MTIEELQEENLNLKDKLKEVEASNTTLAQENEGYKTKIADLQEHNQKLYMRLQVQDKPQDTPKEPTTPGCKDVAMKYKGVIN